MVHVTTGNSLDVVYTYDVDGNPKILGLKPWDEERVIPLRNPSGLASVLTTLINEFRYNTKGDN